MALAIGTGSLIDFLSGRIRPLSSRKKLTVKGEAKLIQSSRLFDQNWYVETYGVMSDPFLHYIEFGAERKLQPHPLFDGEFYCAKAGDISTIAHTPLGHFIATGGQVQPGPHLLFDAAWYAGRYPLAARRDAIAFRDYILRGAVEGLSPHPLFDVEYYLSQYPTLKAERINPLTHFVACGGFQKANPNRYFDAAWYLDTHALKREGKINPLIHYLEIGSKKGFRPSPRVDLRAYRQETPNAPQDDLAAYVEFVAKAPVTDDHVPAQIGAASHGAQARTGAHGASAEMGGSPSLQVVSEIAILASIAQGKKILEWRYEGGGYSLNRAASAYFFGAQSYRVLDRDVSPSVTIEFLNFMRNSGLAHKVSRMSASFEEAAAAPAISREWVPYWREQDNEGRFVIDANLFERDIRNKAGDADIIFSKIGLYQERDPLKTLRRMAWLTREYVMFYCPVTAPFDLTNSAERIRFTDQDAWTVSAMTVGQSVSMDEHWRSRGIVLKQFEPYRTGEPWKSRVDAGDWVWFFGSGAINRLCDQAGLDVVKEVSTWESRAKWFLTRRKARAS